MQPSFGPLEVAIGVLGLRDKSEVRTKVTGKDLLWLPHHVGVLLRFFGGVPLLLSTIIRFTKDRYYNAQKWRKRWLTACLAALAANSLAAVCIADKSLSYGDYIQSNEIVTLCKVNNRASKL
jgi:hypothetical protein